MFAKLTALVSGGSTLPYELDDPRGERTFGGWTHHRATSKTDKSAVSVFKFTFSPGQDTQKTEAAKHGIKSLRTLRHPNILVFKDSHEIEEKTSTSLYLVTEPVQLLTSVLEDGQMTEHQKDEYLSMGLRQVACALSFLNNDCHQVHGNVCLASIVVSQNLDWKLCFMDMLSDYTSLSSSMLRGSAVYLSDVYKCPELAKQDWESLSSGPPWMIDSWGLGCLIREVFGNAALHSQANLRETDAIPEDLLKDYQRLLNSQGQKRLNPQRLMKSKYLNNSLVEVVSFLENLAVKETTEKNSFFKRLSQSLNDLPVMVVHQKVLPMVIDALEFGSASPNALGCVMKIADEMDENQFQTSIAPAITRFFNSTDRTIRRVLLENIDKFGDRLPPSLIDETIYPALTNGFSDSNAYLRELTLKSMQHFAAKLSQKTLNQSLLKFLARLQVDPEPSIRANTTVLLGFIADYLGEASCKRILLNAFSRALKDQFPPARLAALKAFAATKKYYGTVEVAQKVIPSVSPLCIDGAEDVKKQALSCMDTFVNVLKEAAVSDMGVPDEAPSTEGKPSVSQNYVAWAVSSLGLAHTVERETKPAPKQEQAMPSQTPSPQTRTEETSRSTFQETHQPSSSDSDEDKWDFDDEQFEEDTKPNTTKTTANTSQKPSAPRTSDSSMHDMKQSVEEDALWADLGMKAERPREAPAAQRRKPARATKPMKLGAKKLNTD